MNRIPPDAAIAAAAAMVAAALFGLMILEAMR